MLKDVPFGIRLLSIITAIPGVFLIILGLMPLILGPFGSPPGALLFMRYVGMLVFVPVTLIFGTLFLLIAYGLLKFDRRAWIGAITLYGGMFVLGLLVFLLGAFRFFTEGAAGFRSNMIPLAIDMTINFVIAKYVMEQKELYQ